MTKEDVDAEKYRRYSIASICAALVVIKEAKIWCNCLSRRRPDLSATSASRRLGAINVLLNGIVSELYGFKINDGKEEK